MDMRKLEELKEKMMHELDMVSAKPTMTIADISMIDTLAHSIKNLCKIMESEEEGYSGGDWEADGSYRRGYSGRRHMVRGHYSRNAYGHSYGDGYEGRSYREMLEQEYSNARDERERETIRRMMERM